jgi:uncharacterized protein with HEPN domain
MKRDDNVYLHHIMDAIELIEDYTKGMSENEFLTNSMAHDAVVRQIEIIGEAARNISDEFQSKYPELPWAKMVGIRNKITHEYFNVNYAIVWDTVKDDLPSLKKSINKIL